MLNNQITGLLAVLLAVMVDTCTTPPMPKESLEHQPGQEEEIILDSKYNIVHANAIRTLAEFGQVTVEHDWGSIRAKTTRHPTVPPHLVRPTYPHTLRGIT